MDLKAVLALYDEQVRRSPPPAPGGERVEHEPHLSRILRERDGWGMVSWSRLDGLDADAVIAGEIERLSGLCNEWEWKHYSHDRPADLPRRLLEAGFEAGQLETVLVAETAALALEEELPPGVELELIADWQGARSLVEMQDAVFGRGVPGMAERLLAGIEAEPPTTIGVAAVAEGSYVAGGRLELEPGSDFAGLWGGATAAPWRGRGIFRALVARRAALAAERGYRFLHVDALPTSRPILERLGFVILARTTPYLYCRDGPRGEAHG